MRERGDEAVLEYSRRFDPAAPESLVVPSQELDEAMAGLGADVYAGLETAIANVAQVAAAGVPEDVSVTLPQGQQVLLREVPVSSVAVYVPGGRSPYPSTVVMGTVTARAAGVLEVVVCAPPGREGHVDATTLAACRLCGVSRVYCMGGAQAIAALAYGTATVDPVDVIVGPGNLYVQEAKRQLSGTVGIDGFAGPSDLLIVFDEERRSGARGTRHARAGGARPGDARGRALRVLPGARRSSRSGWARSPAEQRTGRRRARPWVCWWRSATSARGCGSRTRSHPSTCS